MYLEAFWLEKQSLPASQFDITSLPGKCLYYIFKNLGSTSLGGSRHDKGMLLLKYDKKIEQPIQTINDVSQK